MGPEEGRSPNRRQTTRPLYRCIQPPHKCLKALQDRQVGHLHTDSPLLIPHMSPQNTLWLPCLPPRSVCSEMDKRTVWGCQRIRGIPTHLKLDQDFPLSGSKHSRKLDLTLVGHQSVYLEVHPLLTPLSLLPPQVAQGLETATQASPETKGLPGSV